VSRGELPDIRTIHERIAYARRLADLTQRQLAGTLGIGIRTLQSYESGETPIPATLVPKIERIAHVPPGWILYDGDAEEWEEDDRRRLPPGSGLVSTIVAVGILALSGLGEDTAQARPCHCYFPAGARKPRVQLARKGGRIDPRKGTTNLD